MQLPLQITARGLSLSEAAEADIRAKPMKISMWPSAMPLTPRVDAWRTMFAIRIRNKERVETLRPATRKPAGIIEVAVDDGVVTLDG